MFMIRPCTLLDAPLLDTWEPPQGDGDHLHWLMTQQKNPLTRTFIGETTGSGPVCFGRLTGQSSFVDIGWFTAPAYRRMGHGLSLAYLLREQATKPLQATIHTANAGSEAIARHLGMKPLKDDDSGEFQSDLDYCEGLRTWVEVHSGL